MGIYKNELGILDQYFILSMFSKDIVCAKAAYRNFVHKYDDEAETEEMEFLNELSEYRSERRVLIRDATSEQVVDFVSICTMSDKKYINIKYIKNITEMKALCVFLMRCLCDMKEKDICKFMGNITQSHAAKLYNTGMKLINEQEKYKNIIQDFLLQEAS